MQALAVGDSDILPLAFEAHPWRMEALPSAESIDNPIQLRNGELDLARVALLFYPLLIVAVTFNLLSGERESGILALTLAQPVRLSTLLWAKLAPRFVLVTGTMVILTWISACFGDILTTDSVIGLVFWTGATVLYGCFWFAAAVVVNLGKRSAAANGLILSLLWILLVFVLPTGISTLARRWYPTPSRTLWIAADRMAKQDIYKYPMHHNQAALEQDSWLLQKFSKSRPDFNWKADEKLNGEGWQTDIKYRDFDFFREGRGPRIQAAWAQEYDRRLRVLDDRFRLQQSSQREFVQLTSVLSPAISLHNVLHELAGTAGWRYTHFLAQRDRYFGEMHEFLWPLAFTDAVVTPEHFDRMPRFFYREELRSDVYRRALTALLPLVIAVIAVCGWIWLILRFRKSSIAIT